jgi:predicted acetyltransferase
MAEVSVSAATDADRGLIENLFSLYMHDLSEFVDLEPDDHGKFIYPRMAQYWSERGRHPFVIRSCERAVGFALVRKGSEATDDPDVWDLAEFFVLRKYRRSGTGRDAAHTLWRTMPGLWYVLVRSSNAPACDFWARTVEAYTTTATAGILEKGDRRWRSWRFQAERA